MPPQGSYIRVMCLFKNCQLPIQRCSKHMTHEFRRENDVSKTSFTRCYDPNAKYETTPEGHVSVIIPIGSSINEGSLLAGKIENFEFQCSNNCVSQLQKTPIQFIATLENNYVILSRQAININVSASPGRDMKNWERSIVRHQLLQVPKSPQPMNKKRAIHDDNVNDNVVDSTSSNSNMEYADMNRRVREGLEALEVVPRQVIEYYKQLRAQHSETSHPHSWPICSSCYQPLDITMFSTSSQEECTNTKFTLIRTLVPLKHYLRSA